MLVELDGPQNILREARWPVRCLDTEWPLDLMKPRSGFTGAVTPMPPFQQNRGLSLRLALAVTAGLSGHVGLTGQRKRDEEKKCSGKKNGEDGLQRRKLGWRRLTGA